MVMRSQMNVYYQFCPQGTILHSETNTYHHAPPPPLPPSHTHPSRRNDSVFRNECLPSFFSEQNDNAFRNEHGVWVFPSCVFLVAKDSRGVLLYNKLISSVRGFSLRENDSFDCFLHGLPLSHLLDRLNPIILFSTTNHMHDNKVSPPLPQSLPPSYIGDLSAFLEDTITWQCCMMARPIFLGHVWTRSIGHCVTSPS